MSLEGRVAVVTGGAGGLGTAIVAELTALGATAVALDLHGAELEADVADAASVERAAERLLAEQGRCDVLVNNAGVLARAPLDEHPIELWDRIVSVNLRGAFVCTQTFGRPMLAAGSGAIVNVASLAADAPSYGNGAYCATKAGLLALTRQTAVEWGPRGIRANAVSPAYMPTPMVADMAGAEARARTHNVPLGRTAETSDVARVVAFLAGDEASYLNGINVPVDGALAQARAGGWAPKEVG